MAMRVPLSENETVPLTVPGVTVTVNVTAWVWTDGFSDETKVIDAVAGLTTCETAAEVLKAWVGSPPYCAVREWVPAPRFKNIRVARLAPESVAVPSAVVPSKNVMVPVAAGATVAVSETGCPNVDGFGDDVSVVVV